MAVANVDVYLRAIVGPFQAQLRQAGQSVTTLGNQMLRTQSKVLHEAESMARGMLAFGAAVGFAFVGAVKKAADFEAAMRNVNSIAQVTEAEFQRMSTQVLALTREFPQSATTLAKALYNIASSGFEGAQAMEVLRASAAAASAGLTTADTAAKAISAVLNAYGDSVGSAAYVSDVLFKTVDKGVVTFEELAGHMGQFIGLAAQAGVPIEEVGAAYATMTRAGLGAAEASTSLARVISAFIKPSEALKQTVQGLGYATAYDMLQTNGLRGALEELNGVTGGSVVASAQLFREVRGLRGVLALASQGGQLYNEVFGEFNDRSKVAGSTLRALSEQQKSTSYQFSLLKNRLSEAAIAVGNELLPAVNFLIDAGQQLFNIWEQIPGPVQAGILIFIAASAAIATLGAATLLVSVRVAALSKMFKAVSTIMPTLSAGIQAATTALGGFGRIAAVAFNVAGAAAIGIAVVTMADNIHDAVQNLQAGAPKISDVALRMFELGSATDDLNGKLSSLSDVARLSRDQFSDDLFDAFNNLLGGRDDADPRRDADTLKKRLEDIDAAAAQLVQSGYVDEAGTAVERIAAGLQESTDVDLSGSNILRFMPQYSEAINGVALAAQAAGESTNDWGVQTTNIVAFTEAAQDSLDAFLKSAENVAKVWADFLDPAEQFTGLLDAATQAIVDHVGAENTALDDASSAWEQYVEGVRVNLDEYKQVLTERLEAIAQLREGLLTLAEAGGNAADVAQYLSTQPVETAAPMVQSLLELRDINPADFNDLVNLMAMTLPDAVGNATIAFQGQLDVAQAIADSGFAEGYTTSLWNLMSVLQSVTQVTGVYSQTAGEAGAALEGAARSAFAMAMAVYAQTGDVTTANQALDQNIEQLYTAAEAAGVSREAMSQLLDTWGVTPQNFEAVVRVTGQRPAIEQLEGLLAELELYDQVQADAGVEASGVEGVITELQGVINRLNAIDGRHAQSTVTNTTTEIRRLVGPQADGSVLRFFAGGGEHHVAQVASASTIRVWAEPETGGEAYIPLAPTKRPRSIAILEEVANRFGYTLEKYASGGFSRAVAFAKGGMSEAAKNAARVQDVMFDTKDLGYDEYIKILYKRLTSLKKYSDEWYTTWQRVISVTDAAAKAAADVAAEHEKIHDVMYDVGDLSRDSYLAMLQKRLAALTEYSDEWYAVWQRINAVTDDAAKEQKDRLDAVQDKLDEVTDHLDDMRSEMDGYVSDLSNIYDTAFSKFTGAQDDYADALQRRQEQILEQTKSFRDDIIATYEDIANPVKIFGTDKDVTSTELERALRHRVDATQRFAAVYAQLATRGLSQDVLTQVAQGGPEGLSLAEALLKVDPSLVNEAMRSTAAVGAGVADVALSWERARIEAQVYADIALPAMRDFEDLLQEELSNWKERNAQQEIAEAWARRMATDIYPQLAAAITIAAQAQERLTTAMTQAGTPGWGSSSAETGMEAITRIANQVDQGVRTLDSVRASLGLAPASSAAAQNDASIIAQGIDAIERRIEQMFTNAGRSFDVGGWLQPGYTLAYNGTGAPERVGGPAMVIESGAVVITAGAGVDTASIRAEVRQGFAELHRAIQRRARN